MWSVLQWLIIFACGSLGIWLTTGQPEGQQRAAIFLFGGGGAILAYVVTEKLSRFIDRRRGVPPEMTAGSSGAAPDRPDQRSWLPLPERPERSGRGRRRAR